MITQEIYGLLINFVKPAGFTDWYSLRLALSLSKLNYCMNPGLQLTNNRVVKPTISTNHSSESPSCAVCVVKPTISANHSSESLSCAVCKKTGDWLWPFAMLPGRPWALHEVHISEIFPLVIWLSLMLLGLSKAALSSDRYWSIQWFSIPITTFHVLHLAAWALPWFALVEWVQRCCSELLHTFSLEYLNGSIPAQPEDSAVPFLQAIVYSRSWARKLVSTIRAKHKPSNHSLNKVWITVHVTHHFALEQDWTCVGGGEGAEMNMNDMGMQTTGMQTSWLATRAVKTGSRLKKRQRAFQISVCSQQRGPSFLHPQHPTARLQFQTR